MFATDALPGSANRRFLNPFSLFFSKPNSCDSGELALQDTYGEQRIEFDAGDLVMYPGTSVHGVEPVTRGARLACFFGSKAGFASTRSEPLSIEHSDTPA